MAIDYTVTALIADLKSRINSPTSDQAQNNARYTLILDKVLHEEMVPHFLSMKADHFLTALDTTPTGGQLIIPSRAIGAKIKGISQLYGGSEVPINIIDSADVAWNTGYYLLNDRICLMPTSYWSQSMRMWYFRRPGYLVQTSACGQISAINTGTNTVSMTGAPTTWTNTTLVDFISANPMFPSWGDDYTPTSVSMNTTPQTMTFSSLPTGLTVGDWVCPQYQSCIPQIPADAHGLLVTKAARRILIAMGNLQGAQAIANEEKGLLQGSNELHDPRVDSQPQIIVSRTWGSPRNLTWRNT